MNSRPKLSICIPTYNRHQFIEHCLQHISNDLKLPFSFEIVISDNSTSDETHNVVKRFQECGLPIFYVKQEYTTPAYHNQCAALRHARGEYAVYMSDDDYIIAEGLISAISFMDNRIDVVAAFAAYEIYDGITNSVLSRDFNPTNDMIFSKDSFISAFNFFATSGFRPEVGIYRSNVLGSMITPRTFNAPSFVNLAHLIQLGTVYIPQQPFYRFVIRSALNPQQSHEGIHWARKLWNQEVGGIEELFFVMSQTTGIQLDANGKAALGHLLDNCELVRLISAMSLSANAGDYLEAYELFVRINTIMVRRSIPMDTYPQIRETAKLFTGRVEIDAIAFALSTMTAIKNILVCGISNKEAIASLLETKGMSKKYNVKFIDDIQGSNEYKSSENFIITSTDSNVQFLADIGFRPGMIASIESLTRRYNIPPALLN